MIVEPKAGKREALVKDNHNAKSYTEVILHIAEKMYPVNFNAFWLLKTKKG